MSTGLGKGLLVTRAIQSLASRFSHGISDCPPMLGTLMINALATCDQLLIPAQPDYLSLKGLDRMIHTLSMIEKSLQKNTLSKLNYLDVSNKSVGVLIKSLLKFVKTAKFLPSTVDYLINHSHFTE